MGFPASLIARREIVFGSEISPFLARDGRLDQSIDCCLAGLATRLWENKVPPQRERDNVLVPKSRHIVRQFGFTAIDADAKRLISTHMEIPGEGAKIQLTQT